MKKFLVSMMAVLTAILLVACSNASNKKMVHVGVLQYVEHPSLSAARKGFIEELKKENDFLKKAAAFFAKEID